MRASAVLRPLLALALVGVAVLALVGWLAYGTGPRFEGTVEVEGLGAEVGIALSPDDVPVITAATEADAMAGLGYVHALRNAWPMALLRQTALGGTTLWFRGDGYARLDAHARTLGLAADARAAYADLGDDDRAALDAYARGVNRAFEAGRLQQEDEFVFLEVTPEPWEPWHSLAVERLVAYLGTPPARADSAFARGLPYDLDAQRFARADSLLRVWLHVGGTEHSLAVAYADSAGTALFQRHVFGRSALNLVRLADLRIGDRRTVVGTVPGTLAFPAGWGPDGSWSVFLTSDAAYVPADSVARAVAYDRVVDREGRETLVAAYRTGAGLFLRDASENEAAERAREAAREHALAQRQAAVADSLRRAARLAAADSARAAARADSLRQAAEAPAPAPRPAPVTPEPVRPAPEPVRPTPRPTTDAPPPTPPPVTDEEEEVVDEEQEGTPPPTPAPEPEVEPEPEDDAAPAATPVAPPPTPLPADDEGGNDETASARPRSPFRFASLTRPALQDQAAAPQAQTAPQQAQAALPSAPVDSTAYRAVYTPPTVWRLAWQGFGAGTDVGAWRALLAGRPADAAFGLFRGEGLLVRGNDVRALGSPAVVSPVPGGLAVGGSALTRWAAGRAATVLDSLGGGALATDAYSAWAAAVLPPLLAALPEPMPVGKVVEETPLERVLRRQQGRRRTLRVDRPDDPALDDALRFLRGWDYRYTPDAIGASLFEAWNATHREVTGRGFGDPAGAGGATVDSAAAVRLEGTFQRTLADLRRRYGPDPVDWRWDRVQADHRYFPVWSVGADSARGPQARRYQPVRTGLAGHPTALLWGPSAAFPRTDASAVWVAWGTPDAVLVRARNLNTHGLLARVAAGDGPLRTRRAARTGLPPQIRLLPADA